VLAILPGTDFRASADHLGLVYDPRPPYYVKSTPTFPAQAFRPALLECERVFDMELDHISPPSLVDSGPSIITDPSEARLISKWIVNPNATIWSRLLPAVAAKATDPFTVWFRGPCDPKAMLSILTELSSTNPHMCMHVVMECTALPAPAFFHKALANVSSPSLYQNRAYQPLYEEDEVVNVNFWLLQPDPGDSDLRDAIREEYESVATVIWDMAGSEEERLFQSVVPLLISDSASNMRESMHNLFAILQNIHPSDSHEVLFRDHELRDAWQALTGRVNPTYEFGESILLTE
jgi:hypothetical protein